MPDEYYQRYKPQSHETLFNQLMAGSPTQIDGMVTSWKSAEGSARSVSDTLKRDLERLQPTWNSAAGREFQRRLGLIVSFADHLAGEFTTMHTGLTSMSGALTEAKKQAEAVDPEKTDDNDKTISGAAKGAAVGTVFGPVGTVAGGVVGGFLGHDQDEEEKAKARERMVVLVATLAAGYGVTDHGWPKTAVQPPADLPGGNPDGKVAPKSAPHSGTPRQAPGTGFSERTSKTTGAGTTRGDDSFGSGEDGLGGPGGATTVPVTGPGGDQTGGFGSSADDPSTGTALQSGGGSLTGTSGLGGGSLGGPLGGGSLGGASPIGSSSGTALSSGTLGTSGTGLAGLSGGGTGGVNGTGSGDGRSAAVGGRSAAGSGSGRSAAGAGRGIGAEEPVDERLTWLTEDDMVWGEDDAPPGVLGAVGSGED